MYEGAHVRVCVFPRVSGCDMFVELSIDTSVFVTCVWVCVVWCVQCVAVCVVCVNVVSVLWCLRSMMILFSQLSKWC